MNNFISYRSPKRSSARRKRQESILLVAFGVLLSFLCAGILGFALYLGGYNPFVFPFQLTATALSERNASCKVLIDRAIQASGSSCGGTASNNVCYGNITLKAELAPDITRRFSERGDVVAVHELRRLSAAPLDLDRNEWGIAIFKVIANLPRSLPGETITMVVFGNTTLDNPSGSMEAFYFFSELGQIACEAVPFDGLMINSPDGSGIRINVNGAELTLMGNASLKAVRNGQMEVSLFRGSGRIVSNGQEQYFGAGQKVHVGLGGENGVQSISGPSAPEALTQAELNAACSVTGQYCTQGEVIPVSALEAQGQLQNAITFTPTSIFTQTATRIPSPTMIPTNTSFVLPSWTPRRTATPTRTLTPVRTATRTSTPTRTITPIPTIPVNTAIRTNTPITPSATQTPSATPNAAQTAMAQTATAAAAQTAIAQTATAAAANAIGTSAAATATCGSITSGPLTNPNPTELAMDITNSNAATITIDSFFADWPNVTPSQKLSKLFLGPTEIWNITDNVPPSNIPTESNWNNASRSIAGDGTPRTFIVQFQDPLSLNSGNYQVRVTFDNGCQVSGTVTLP